MGWDAIERGHSFFFFSLYRLERNGYSIFIHSPSDIYTLGPVFLGGGSNKDNLSKVLLELSLHSYYI